ncbi:kinase-like domain-containing protein [Daedaleopsis nitida]|nr:kinase-like domain-containing protein [Daedaleopsis nitida]
MRDFTGTLVGDRYQLVEMLGLGAYGAVYGAIDDASPEPLCRAIKVIPKAGKRPYDLGRIRNEIKLHRKVSSHPNVVTLHDAFEDEGHFFIVLELCDGGDLYGHICKNNLFATDQQLRKAFLSIVDAVRTCHQAGIFHRDLKPDNILLNEDVSEVYIADFGLATTRDMTTQHGCGTDMYMSPESYGPMTNFKPFYPRFCDIWALGVILINMLSGRSLWEKATPKDKFFARFLREANFFQDRLPISDGANAIIMRIFALEPRDRITLDDLYREIADLDTFYLSEDELANATEEARRAAESIKLHGLSIVDEPSSEADEDEFDELLDTEGGWLDELLSDDSDDYDSNVDGRPWLAAHGESPAPLVPSLQMTDSGCSSSDSEVPTPCASETASVSSNDLQKPPFSGKLRLAGLRRMWREGDMGEAILRSVRLLL